MMDYFHNLFRADQWFASSWPHQENIVINLVNTTTNILLFALNSFDNYCFDNYKYIG